MCTARALRSHRDGAVARAAAAAAASARARSGGGRADGRHACGHAAVQRRAVRGQGDVGLCVGPPAERRGARARAAGLRGRWRLRIRSRNVVELGPRFKGHKIKSGLFPQFHGGHVPQTGPKIHRKTAFWALQIQKFSRCAPNHGGRAAGVCEINRRALCARESSRATRAKNPKNPAPPLAGPDRSWSLCATV